MCVWGGGGGGGGGGRYVTMHVCVGGGEVCDYACVCVCGGGGGGGGGGM